MERLDALTGCLQAMKSAGIDAKQYATKVRNTHRAVLHVYAIGPLMRLVCSAQPSSRKQQTNW